MEIFESFAEMDYARSGAHAIQTVELQEGPLEQVSHALEPHLRSLGLPTSLKKGIVTLIHDYTVCKKGQTLTPDQARILKLLEIKMAEFRILVDSVWSKPDNFKLLLQIPEDDDEDAADEEETFVDAEMDDADDDDDDISDDE